MQWGFDIIGPLPRAPGQRQYILVASDYFTKWMKGKAYPRIREVELNSFVWKNIICRFGIPKALIIDNGQLFDGKQFKSLCEEYNIVTIILYQDTLKLMDKWRRPSRQY